MWFANVFAGLIGLIFVGSPPWCSDAFNVETKHYAVYRNETRSMFGFAVSVYRDRHGRGWAIVGAPEAETPQVGVYRGGAVYKCDIAADDRCSMIHFDTKGNNHVRNPSVANGLSQIDNKTLQWFGATVSASLKDGGPILACAPRYIWFSVSQPKYDPEDNRWSKESTAGNRREPVGTCWVVSNSFNESQEFSPCRTRYWGYHRQGSCQAGLGASMSKNGERLFIGAPGSWYWQGQIYSISTAMRLKFVATMLFTPEAEASGQAFSQSLNSRTRIMFTKEGPAKEDDSYMGYSVTTGDFIGNGDSGTAVGVPRGSDLLGKVILFTSNMTNPRNITGEQMGAYFGYAIASGDIDGDGLDDLIVGAPMYTVPDNPEMTIETGRVYVIYQGAGPEKFRKVDSRDGESNRGRFGLSLASLGDIDRDGYGDFVVGAPYGGLHGRGAVYIYHGSSAGVLEKYSQVIYAENLDVPVETFGFSVGGGLDLDGNHYPDLMVGAYESGTAVFFRSRPVIKMDSYVTFDQESKLISLDDRNCTLSDGSRVTCFPLRACFKYTGEGVFSKHNFNIQYVNRSITVDRDRQFCRTVQVYVTPNIRDKLTSLDAEMRMSLDEERYEDNRQRDPRLPLRPVLGSTTSRKDSLTIRKNCGSDNVCIPDLQLNVTSNVLKYLLGSGKRLELDVLVQNMGEDAFESTYHLKLPAGIDYIKVEKIETMGVPVQCSAPKQSNNNTLRCDIGNPLQKNGLVKFRVLLQPVTSHGMKPIYEFEMDVNTTNPENPSTSEDNAYTLRLPIWIETDLRVDGESKPKDLQYKPDNYTSETNATTEIEFGPAVTHNYTIRNLGPSDVIEAEVFLIWPAQTLAGDELLYLLEQPETSGPIACEGANANYLSLKLDQRRRLYSLHSDPSGVILDESQSGKTINVQRGFDAERQKANQKEETEINSGDSSSIQKTRHSTSSSSNVVTGETRRIQLSTTGDKPDVLVTTYTQNNSGTSSINTGNLSGSNRGVIFHTESGGYGDTGALGGGFRTGDEPSLGSRVPSLEEHYGTRENHSETIESRWGETSVSGGRTASSSFDSELTESEKRYQVLRQQEEQRRQEEELRRLEEEQRLRKQEEQLAAQRQREDLDRLLYQRRQEEERRRYKEEEEQRRQHEEEETRRRLEEEGIRRRQEEERRRLEVHEQERRYGVSSGSESGFVTGDREETVRGGELGFHLRNVSSAQELETLFGSLSKSSSHKLYDRQGRHYVQFMGRFRTSADKKEYIEFQDGSMFPLQNRYGDTSYVSEATESRDSRFLRIEGELLVDSHGKGFIVLKDSRRFPLQGSFTYTEERSYTLGDPRGSQQARGNDYESKGYSRSWDEDSNHTGDVDYESRYTSTHVEKKTEDRRVSSRIHGRDNRETFDETNTQSVGAGARIRRESDVMEVKEFKKFERLHRRPRDLEKDLLAEESELNGKTDYDSDPRTQGPASPCDTARCVMLRCVVGPLKKDQEVWIGARYRVDARTLKKVAVQEIKTNVEPSITPSAPDVIPLWVVVLSACAGTIILLLLIYLLHKCGFFKRNRPSDAPERQPLNRNGHFHGDDH
ncbi:PREDICTED: LOW QUALITY PROTEIN: integrin alpha-PS2-like [Dufourea novaeangliae]|uniref:LOW QUALITY PROTEIN: integrin alpha-PS2-like n=1 Tax=Dufourea novaeangliae TaxID=178035 RepID=UPI000767806A|nr:PREDICTED: LOW QUALITY PROTEIN: integrin alpha-PS2-like [Dufourea novaeangliae]